MELASEQNKGPVIEKGIYFGKEMPKKEYRDWMTRAYAFPGKKTPMAKAIHQSNQEHFWKNIVGKRK